MNCLSAETSVNPCDIAAKFEWQLPPQGKKYHPCSFHNARLTTKQRRGCTPEVGSYSRRSSATAVVLPLPLAPTSARLDPAGMRRLRPRSTTASRRPPYAKCTFRNSTAPLTGAGRPSPATSLGVASRFSTSITLRVAAKVGLGQAQCLPVTNEVVMEKVVHV